VDTSGRGRLNRGQRRANMADALCIQETYWNCSKKGDTEMWENNRVVKSS
jgi:hypothetical protein